MSCYNFERDEARPQDGIWSFHRGHNMGYRVKPWVIGQGNGGGLVSWHSHMLPLEIAYSNETGQKVDFSNPDSTRTFSQWLIGFVDDNTLLIKLYNLGFDAPVESLLEAAIACLGVWKRLIHITGGVRTE